MIVVDDMRLPARVGRLSARWSHLYTDGHDDELHAFADRLGLKRAWFQHEGKVTSHYDVTDTMRTKAIALGAVSIGYMSREALDIIHAKLDARGELLSTRDAHTMGLCVDCKNAQHSAGRPRCESCHADYMKPTTPEQDLDVKATLTAQRESP